ncbi:response regulator [Yunchengibacter salinarum]|uniref:response regulator n=1 Tax=Yunchengibacter salinarum TaxID=3133399 RepID=UPI0035B579B4
MARGPVLLLDDEDIILRINAAAVSQFGFQSVTANSVADALDLMREVTPSLIISDVQMPGEGGFDLVHAMEDAGTKSMPVIYLTAYDDLDILRGGLRAGGDDFVIKGTGVDWLRERIAFWAVSGFRGLPGDLRRRALRAANAARGDRFEGVRSVLALNSALVRQITEKLSKELAALPPDYGNRLMERVHVVARASHCLVESAQGVGDHMTFPLHLQQIIHRLNRPWRDTVWPIFDRFDRWGADARFAAAGAQPLSTLTMGAERPEG